jgi:hypothetical protein
MSHADRCVFSRGYIAVRNVAESLMKIGSLVVGGFPFQRYFAMDAVAEAPALTEAKSRINPAQAAFLKRLLDHLDRKLESSNGP